MMLLIIMFSTISEPFKSYHCLLKSEYSPFKPNKDKKVESDTRMMIPVLTNLVQNVKMQMSFASSVKFSCFIH